jgi:hypothetical protein
MKEWILSKLIESAKNPVSYILLIVIIFLIIL